MTSDIARRFANTMIRFDDVPRAAAAAFDQWYNREHRRDRYYVAACSAYLDEQEKTHALPA
jgi:hypothetical protein